MIEICAVGGYKEVGKNMTAVKIDDEVVILDMGIHLENYINFTDDKEVKNISWKKLVEIEAIPDDSKIMDWHDQVVAIIPSHAHLDHIAAIPFLERHYTAPLIMTPFSAAVLRAVTTDNKMSIKNKLIELPPNGTYKISDNITIEFIHVTHSTPQTVIIAIHTKYGKILYSCDFKFDNHPGIGKKPNYQRLEEVGNEGVVALICDSTYATLKSKMPSEAVARAMLEDVLLSTDNKNNLVIVTTFSSHLARLKAIIETGRKMGRHIVLLGRSLSKYITAGLETNLFSLPEDVELVKYSSKIKKSLRKIKDRKKYLLIVTGHQGETKATLYKMAHGLLEFDIKPNDHVVFSCTVIPTESNIQNRDALEEELESKKARIFRDIHVSGHAAREDLRYLINLTKPKNVIPAHGSIKMRSALKNLCDEIEQDSFLIEEGERKTLIK